MKCIAIYIHNLGIPCNITRDVGVRGKGAIVTFSSNNPRATFTCKLDQKKFKTCKHLCVYMYK